MNNGLYISKSLNTIVELLDARGIKTNITTDSLTEHINQYANTVLFAVVLEKVKVIYYLANKFKWSEVKKTLEAEQEAPYELYIFVVKDKISQNYVKAINELNLNIQTFDIKEIQFNRLKHSLVPPHEKITSDTEIKAILESYSVKNRFQLPIILKNDIVSRLLGFKSGDIIKITRPSPTAGEYITYRCCL